MIIGIGMDLVEVARVERMLARHGQRAVERIFTGEEAAYCAATRSPAESFAARFAAKEAVLKALGTGLSAGMTWRDVEVVASASGAPRVQLAGSAAQRAASLGVQAVHLSLTHTRELAAAYVILDGGDMAADGGEG